MINNDKTYKLFTSSGCLSLEAIKRLNNNSLSSDEQIIVKKHLETCEMCTDASEGMSLISDENKLNALLSEINDNVKKQLDTGNKPIRKILSISNKLFYSGAAASIIILIGLLYYFQYYTNDKFRGEWVAVTKQVHEVPIPLEQHEFLENEEIEISGKKHQKGIVNEKGSHEKRRKKNSVIKSNHYKAPLDMIKSKDSGALTAYEKTKEPVIERVSKPVDIASTLPAEYYLGSITISEDSDLENFEIPQITDDTSISESHKGKSSGKNGSKHFFRTIDKMPEYPGGQNALFQFLYSNLKYPEQAHNSGLQGIVLVAFIVEEDGTISNTKILHGIGGGCDEEAKRVIELMPRWTPAIVNEKNGRVLFKIPIRFKLY